MESYSKQRESFLVAMANKGIELDIARSILRNANTIQRLSTAECNGDYPCDNGERKVRECSKCQSGYVPSSLNKAGICPNCRAAQRIVTLLSGLPIMAIFQGDPRGACVRIADYDPNVNDESQHRGIYVPTRDY